MKKFFFYNLSVFLFFSTVLLFDFILSNTILKYQHCYNYSEYYYDLKKNCSGKYRFKSSFPLVKTITDEMGLRTGSQKVEKKKNKKNIFIFGDSFTYGVGIKYEKTYAGLLASNLKKYNVYNFAVGSYSPTVHLFKLKKALRSKVIPEKIFIFLDLTDVIDEASRWYYDKNDDEVKLTTNRLFKVSQNDNKNFKKNNFKITTNLSSYVNYNLRNIRSSIKLKIKDEYKIKTSIQGNFTYTDINKLDKRFWADGTFNKGIESIKKNFSEFQKISIDNGFDVYVVIYPWAETLEFGQEKFNWSEFAKEICNYDNCHVIDSIPEFLKYP